MFFFKKKKSVEKKIDIEKRAFEEVGLTKLIAYIRTFCGVNLEPKQDVLTKRIKLFCEPRELYSYLELLEKSKSDEILLQDLINEITVNETYFYRELPQLEEAIEYARELKQKVKILCAPCASGEEVYSLAILAEEKGIMRSNIELIGIDINSEAIENANKAIYSKRSLHRLDEQLKECYFTSDENRYHIKKEKMPRIDFRVVNIFDDDFMKLGLFDIIFSRNMMIYFDDDFKHKAIKRFYELLKPHGRLYAGHADLIPQTPLFIKEVKARLYFYKKAKLL